MRRKAWLRRWWRDRRVKSGAILAAGLAIVAGLFSCQEVPSRSSMELTAHPTMIEGQPEIRIALRKGLLRTAASCPAPVRILDDRGRCLAQLPSLEAGTEVSSSSAGWLLGGRFLGSAESVQIVCGAPGDAAEAGVLVDGESCGRKVALVRESRGRSQFMLVAYLDIEAYLCGVLAGEVPYERWHPEALKAQAVASRTYALAQMKRRSGEPYDVECTTTSQVYRGGYGRNPILNAAVNATRGQVLTYRYQVFPAYFHSTCGGQTEDVARVLSHDSIPPLAGAACPYCSESPMYSWVRRIAKDRIGQRLRDALGGRQKIGEVRSVEPVPAFGPASRPSAFRVVHSEGETTIPAGEFRLAVGPGSKDLPSVFLSTVRDQGSAVEFAGRGFGHGVGMCQYGSQGMAAGGRDYRQILSLYYPGAELVKLYRL